MDTSLGQRIQDFILSLVGVRPELVKHLQEAADGDQGEVMKISRAISAIDNTSELPQRFEALSPKVRLALEFADASATVRADLDSADESVPDSRGRPQKAAAKKTARKTAKKTPKKARKAAKKKTAAKKTGTRKKAAKKTAGKRAAGETASKKAASKGKVDPDTRVKIAADLKNGHSPKDIAARYGVTGQAVGNVKRFGP
ncbi:MAG: hypothetical protein Q8P13_02100 [bacterium]|nr:hypothetical protein [bacterium]